MGHHWWRKHCNVVSHWLIPYPEWSPGNASIRHQAIIQAITNVSPIRAKMTKLEMGSFILLSLLELILKH